MNGSNFNSMPMNIYKEDDGLKFGTWSDEVSKFMYFDSTKEILNRVRLPEDIADFGGANGLLKHFIPNIVTIDKDESKNPDITADILSYTKYYELVILRYVLHYLNDYEVIQLFKTINAKNILIIQFENNDLIAKYKNSVNEFKYFRTTKQLQALLPLDIKTIYSKEYIVNKEFYINRLGQEEYMPHNEVLKGYYL